MRESMYDNDDATGLEKSFYPSGKLQETINYFNDDRSGSYCLYYENGKIKLKRSTLPTPVAVNGMYIIWKEGKQRLCFTITEISMKLSVNKIIYLLGIGITIHCTGGRLQAGSLSEINDLQQKYPKQAVIVSQKEFNVSIILVNNVPVINMDSYKELTVLGRKCFISFRLEGIFSSHLEMKKLEAYSLVPDRNQYYKKLTVETFVNSMEIDNSVFYDDQYAYGFTFPSVMKGARLVTKYTATNSSVYMPVMFDFGGRIPSENTDRYAYVSEDNSNQFQIIRKRHPV